MNDDTAEERGSAKVVLPQKGKASNSKARKRTSVTPPESEDKGLTANCPDKTVFLSTLIARHCGSTASAAAHTVDTMAN